MDSFQAQHAPKADFGWGSAWDPAGEGSVYSPDCRANNISCPAAGRTVLFARLPPAGPTQCPVSHISYRLYGDDIYVRC